MSETQQMPLPSTPRFDLSGRTAVVTGGNSGIGRATAEILAASGASVAILSRNEAAGRGAASRLDQDGVRADWFGCDVTEESSIEAALSGVVDKLGTPTILINSAGLLAAGTVESTSHDTWDSIMAVNATGPYLCSKHAVPLMREAGSGVIVHVSSEAGLVGIRNLAAYCAAKAAVVALTRCMALDLAADAIRVNCVCPGTTLTPMVEQAAAKLPDPGAELTRYASARPLNRLASPHEIASAVALLASDDCAFATGSILAVDGGYTA